jgi:hypothetical protein
MQYVHGMCSILEAAALRSRIPELQVWATLDQCSTKPRFYIAHPMDGFDKEVWAEDTLELYMDYAEAMISHTLRRFEQGEEPTPSADELILEFI